MLGEDSCVVCNTGARTVSSLFAKRKSGVGYGVSCHSLKQRSLWT
jgi:hypothetical protein